jgi:PPK2 family polyphosphate:nucleotide phosphotransferase
MGADTVAGRFAPSREACAMKLDRLVKKAHTLARPYRVSEGKGFRLRKWNPADTGDLGAEDKPHAIELLHAGVEAMAALQDMLYAQDRWSLLLVFQAMDAAGKDGAIKHVMSGLNPQGCQVVSFKVPSAEELDHDYLWRCQRHLPERGRIGIFNRSYYEEVLVVRVHPELLARQKVPSQLIGKRIWRRRYEDIGAFERHLARNGTVIRKFFLNVSREEQKRRFLERIDTPAKNWKFSAADVVERGFWDDYAVAYEDMIRHTASEYAPWYVVPADNKWYSRLIVAGAVIEALASLDLRYPKVSAAQRKTLAAAKEKLLAEN